MLGLSRFQSCCAPALSNSLVLFLAGFPLALGVKAEETNPEVRFNRDVRPILAAACFRCHGQDAEHRQADLRLDQAPSATEKIDSAKNDTGKNDSGAAWVAGDPASSTAWQRIGSADPDLVMPPPNATRQLTDAEKQTIKQWIEQGAKYESHWAFEPIRPSLSASTASAADQRADSEKASAREWIDAEINKEASARGLVLQAPADARTLARRVAFALTGLPPEIEDVERFANSPTKEAYEAYVDKLLASTHYGEEMAKHWLDVARYGDTHGLHLDNDRLIWPYRDWVVNAYNQNMPFDQFTIEQLAGDLLANPTPSQLVATGFNRCNVTTSEGGAIAEEFQFRYAVDRTSTTIQTFLGLTGGCAVCHDHKYDPVSTREFYSMYSFFYSNADPAMDGNVSTTAPFLKLPTEEQSARLNELDAQLGASLSKLYDLSKRWGAQMPESQAVASKTATHVWFDDALPLGATQRNTSRNSDRWSVDEVTAPMGTRSLVTEFGDKFDQTISGGLVPKWILDNSRISVWAQTDLQEPPEAIYIEVRTDKGAKRWVWCDGSESAGKVDAKADRVIGPLPRPGEWQLLSFPVSELEVGAMVNEIKVGLFGGICYWDGLSISGGLREQDTLRSNWRAWWKQHGNKPVPNVTKELAEANELTQAIQKGPDSEEGKRLENQVKAYFVAWVASDVPREILQAREAWHALKAQREKLDDRIPGTMIYREAGKPRQAHIMLRGQYDAKGDPVEPGGLAALPPIQSPSDAKLDLQGGSQGDSQGGQRLTRLDLAKWLVSDKQPLTARVTVNRFWQQLFGVGLVKTSDDFGTQGAPPSHPQLLDNLAHHFVKSGWDVKALMKEMVLTDAFQRGGVGDEEAYSKDPENRYLARGPRIRLDAEQIRDNALAVSGILDRKIGGAGFRGYQPPKIWEPVGYGDSNTRYYIQQHGQELYRRSLYAYFKRTAPPPFMSNFDAPNRETTCTKRERSNTPLQALQLMNDIQHVEAARCLAERVLKASPQDENSRIERLFQWVLARAPDTYEQQQLARFFDKSLERMQANPEDAKRLSKAGERWVDTELGASVSAEQIAAWTLLCNLVLNLDETVTRN
jgi:hypothetical protein